MRGCFEGIADPVRAAAAGPADKSAVGAGGVGLKYASLLQFDEAARGDDAVRANLRRLYGVGRVPPDTRLRERLDGMDARLLRTCCRRRARSAAATASRARNRLRNMGRPR